MRFIALFLTALFGVVPVALATATFKFEADRVNVYPGETVTFTVTLKNDDSNPSSGTYTNNIYVPDGTSTTKPTTDDPRVTCTGPSQLSSGGTIYWYYECSSSGSMKLESQQTVTTTFQYKVPANAKPGDTITIDSTLRFGVERPPQRRVDLRVVPPPPAGPRLVPFFSEPVTKPSLFGFDAKFEVTITNAGTAATSGDVTFSIELLAPAAYSSYRPLFVSVPDIWREAQSGTSITTSAVLDPGASWKVEVFAVLPAVRGTFGIKGVVEGGNSPRQEAKSADLRYDDMRSAGQIDASPPVRTNGRR